MSLLSRVDVCHRCAPSAVISRYPHSIPEFCECISEHTGVGDDREEVGGHWAYTVAKAKLKPWYTLIGSSGLFCRSIGCLVSSDVMDIEQTSSRAAAQCLMHVVRSREYCPSVAGYLHSSKPKVREALKNRVSGCPGNSMIAARTNLG